MADNVAVTAGSGTTIAADEVVDGTLGTVKVQYVKIMDATLDGTSKAAVGANGLAVDVKAIVSHPVTNAGTFATQSAITAASGSIASGAIASGAVASGAFASGAVSSGAFASGSIASGAMVDVGAIADAAVTAGATGSLSAKLRSISRDIVANIVLAAGTNIIGLFKLSDGTNTAAVKAASTAPAATDPALVVAISPNSVNANGRAAAASSAPVALSTEDNALLARLLPTATASGVTASRVNAAGSTNATSLKASAGQLYTIDVFNAAAYNVFLKLYNKASAPTVGTDTPVMTIPVQAGGGFSKTWPTGLPFATGIAYAITKLQADSDTTAVVAGDLTGNTTWI